MVRQGMLNKQIAHELSVGETTVKAHVSEIMRKLNVVSWETPLAARYLKDAPGLPYVVVYGKSGRRVAVVGGFDLKKLDKAIAAAEKQ